MPTTTDCHRRGHPAVHGRSAQRWQPAATGVALGDDLDPNTTLVVGSVQTTQGTVTEGNTANDDDVRVAIGTLAAGGQATLTYRVRVNTATSGAESPGIQSGQHRGDQRHGDRHRRSFDAGTQRPDPHARRGASVARIDQA